MILTVNESRPFLTKHAAEVDPTSPETLETVDALIAAVAELDRTVEGSRVAGLAAPQIGRSEAVFVARLTLDGAGGLTDDLTVCINPQILFHVADEPTVSSVMDAAVSLEGCYSVPGEYYVVKRHQLITLVWWDIKGELQRARLAGLPAVIAQHEHGHTIGELIPDIGFKAVPAAPENASHAA